ncbi:hypothetical protein BMS3Abin07_00692 [bacterium BMS3Abin07]|nr:hypothetical protein BMS3Abin07_00692 [bacterium BMS3Abin07]GBE32922.1 hypothetical protein BMS3Bbin05_01852 [bacterium BMS3Bbin05]
MKFYTKQHKFYCGIDLRAKKMYLCILNKKKVPPCLRSEIERGIPDN